MTNVLVLGGTGWLSGRIARDWVEAGANVTCLGRGSRPAPDGAVLARGDRDDRDVYAHLAAMEWDEIVDVSSRARHVQAAVDALGPRTRRWTYVSSVSVYADETTVGLDESGPRHAPATVDEPYGYPGHKVAAEDAVAALGDRARIVRPGLIVGPGDPSDRFGYWAAAFARAGDGPVLVPPTENRWCQVIDVDDVAAYVVHGGGVSVVNAVGDPHPLGDVLGAVRAAAGHTGEIVQAGDDDELLGLGIRHWMGERSLPLWLPPEMTGFARHDNARFHATGGLLIPLADTISRVLADERSRGVERPRTSGLSRGEELDAIARLRP